MTQRIHSRRRVLGALAGVAGAAAGFPIAAQDRFPRQRAVTLVCPWAPGGIADTTARRLAQALSSVWGQQVVVDNKAGANGNIGAAAVGRAAPDGYTLMLTLHDGMVIGKAAGFELGYDPLVDLTPIAQVGISDIYWTVKGDAPFKTIGDFVAHAKANPGKLSFGSNGVGSSPHLAMELLNHAAGINLTHVPFRGGAQAVPEVLAGRLDAMMATPALGLSHYQAGALKPIALVGTQRSPLYPQMATIAETYPSVSISLGVGVFGPKGLPRAIAEQVNRDVRQVINAPDMKARFNAEGFPPSNLTAQEYENAIAQEISRMAPLLKRIGFKQA